MLEYITWLFQLTGAPPPLGRHVWPSCTCLAFAMLCGFSELKHRQGIACFLSFFFTFTFCLQHVIPCKKILHNTVVCLCPFPISEGGGIPCSVSAGSAADGWQSPQVPGVPVQSLRPNVPGPVQPVCARAHSHWRTALPLQHVPVGIFPEAGPDEPHATAYGREAFSVPPLSHVVCLQEECH